MSLASLNTSGISSQNNALYQTIRELIELQDKLQKQINSYSLSIGDNSGLNTSRVPFNLLGGQIAFPIVPNLSPLPNILDDYREIPNGWTITDGSGAALAITTVNSTIIKIGSQVIIGVQFIFPATASGAAATLGNLPYTCEPIAGNQWGGFLTFNNSGLVFTPLVIINTKILQFFTIAGVNVTNVQLTGKTIAMVLIYRTNE